MLSKEETPQMLQPTLIACTECGKAVASRALFCPNCGFIFLQKRGLPGFPVFLILPPEVRTRISIMDGVKIGVGFAIVLPTILIAIGVIILAVAVKLA